MPEQSYACTQRDCPAALAMLQWPVECNEDGSPVDEAEGHCPECYTPGNPVAYAD